MASYLIGYARGERVLVENSLEQIAAFIVAHRYEDVLLTDIFDIKVLDTSMGFIMHCPDQHFLQCLLPVLVPMQRGEVEPPAFRPLSDDDD